MNDHLSIAEKDKSIGLLLLLLTFLVCITTVSQFFWSRNQASSLPTREAKGETKVTGSRSNNLKSGKNKSSKKRNNHSKKGKNNKKISSAWSKLFGGKHQQQKVDIPRSTLLIIDVNNVRGACGFSSGSVEAFCGCVALWAKEIASNLPQYQELRVLLAVDHGPQEEIYVYSSPSDVQILVSFAGKMLTADDIIVENVFWLFQDEQWQRLFNGRSDQSQILLVTADRELKNRCYEAASKTRRSRSLKIMKSALLADWLESGVWERYYHLNVDAAEQRKRKFRGYETTKQREAQAQQLYQKLNQGSKKRDERLSWSTSARQQGWFRGKVSSESVESPRKTVTQILLEEWLAQKEEESFTKSPSRKSIKLNKIPNIPQRIRDRYLALDCEMVGVGKDGKQSALARVSIVNWDLQVILDSYVKVSEPVTDYRTLFSGIEPRHIDEFSDAMEFNACHDMVADLFRNKIIVGHGLVNDFKVLSISHPKTLIRDTSQYRPFQKQNPSKRKWFRARRLKDLVTEHLLGWEDFQDGAHDSVGDAQAVMLLFHLVWEKWEEQIARREASHAVLDLAAA